MAHDSTEEELWRAQGTIPVDLWRRQTWWRTMHVILNIIVFVFWIFSEAVLRKQAFLSLMCGVHRRRTIRFPTWHKKTQKPSSILTVRPHAWNMRLTWTGWSKMPQMPIQNITRIIVRPGNQYSKWHKWPSSLGSMLVFSVVDHASSTHKVFTAWDVFRCIQLFKISTTKPGDNCLLSKVVFFLCFWNCSGAISGNRVRAVQGLNKPEFCDVWVEFPWQTVMAWDFQSVPRLEHGSTVLPRRRQGQIKDFWKLWQFQTEPMHGPGIFWVLLRWWLHWLQGDVRSMPCEWQRIYGRFEAMFWDSALLLVAFWSKTVGCRGAPG